MSEIEITAKNLEEAVRMAMEQLQAPREAIEILRVDQADDTLEGAEPLEVRVRVGRKKDYLVKLAQEKVVGILKHMGIFAEVRTQLASNMIKVNLTTKDGSILIGRKGETLEALQHVINRMVNRSGKELPFVLLDIQNYRERRHARLERLAKNAANRAIETGKEVVLEPMPAADRKIIHNFLKSFNGVKTYSRGREGQRQVIVDLQQHMAPDVLEPGNTA